MEKGSLYHGESKAFQENIINHHGATIFTKSALQAMFEIKNNIPSG